MNDTNFISITQIKEFLRSSKNLELFIEDKNERLVWLQKILLRFRYISLTKKNKGIIRRLIRKFTGYSRSQINRLIEKHYKGTLMQKQYKRNIFSRIYKDEDIILLAYTDTVHKRLCGKTTKQILVREYEKYNHDEYANLSNISESHIYNLRKTFIYKSNTVSYKKTNPVNRNIAVRKKPKPNGRPGYIRVDTVHQGDLDGTKGVYHINTVDEVTQWEIIGSVETIEFKNMIPLLEDLIRQYPFRILGFHSDNGSEYINHEVAKMLNKLLAQFTKSRSRKTNDNALVESKNGSVIRKHMGYVHIPKINAYKINKFYKIYFNQYLNYHRPCLYATTYIDEKGKQRKKYKECMTPYEKLKSLENVGQYLKTGIIFENLNKIAYAESDNEFAAKMMKAKQNLFNNFIFPF